MALVLLCTHVLELYKFNICCIRVNYSLLKLWYIVGMFMSIVLWVQVAVFSHVISDNVDDWDRWFLGRAPRTRETLPDFRELCQVVRHSRVFRGLTGSQRTPRVWGVTRHIQRL